MSKSVITDSLLSGIADAIREKTGGESSLTPSEMITEIENISVGGEGGETPEELAELLIYKTLSSTKYPTPVPLVDFGPVEEIPQSFFGYYLGNRRADGFGVTSNIEKIICTNVTRVYTDGMGNHDTSAAGAQSLKEAHFPACRVFDISACAGWYGVHTVEIKAAVTIGGNAFLECGEDLNPQNGKLYINASVQTIEARAFGNSGFGEVHFTGTGTPQSIASDAFLAGNISDIYVPWAEGSVANAPWGATTATIHYNYTSA